MDDALPPALTPESWAEVFAQIERAPIVLGRGHQVVACIECNEDGSEDFHAAAAIALYDQPFGFTARDVHDLDIAIIDTANVIPGTHRHRLMLLRDRIASLLPPE